MISSSFRAQTRSVAFALALVLLALGTVRAARADRLVLVEPSGAVQAAVTRALRETSLQLVVVHGLREEPRAIGAAQRARFVVWRDTREYVLLDLGTRQERRRPVATLDDEVSATALADDIVAWAVSAADVAPVPDEPSVLLDDIERAFGAPLHRIELAVGARHDVAKRADVLASFNLSLLRRVGPVELGPTVIVSENTSRWEQAAYVFHVRLPVYGAAGTRGSVIPRVGAGVLLGTAKEPPMIGVPQRTDSGLWPVVELGLTLEARRHRFSFGIDGGATFHLRQSLDDFTSVDIAPHVEPALLFRLGLLLY